MVPSISRTDWWAPMGSQDRTSLHVSGSSTTFFAPCLAMIRSFRSSISYIRIHEASPKPEIIVWSSVSVDQQRLIPNNWLGRILLRCKGSDFRWYAAAKRKTNVHTIFEDEDHASDKVTRRSQKGILILCKRAPVIQLSKKQNLVETSTFGSEFTALKLVFKLIIVLQYKLHMFGVQLEGPNDMFCDNEAIFKNTYPPESLFQKKHHIIAYHKCREAVDSLICRIAKEDT